MRKGVANDRTQSLRTNVARAPTGPGVYRWLNTKGDVLYVGKAKNLRARLRSYLANQPKDPGPWKRALMGSITAVDWTVTGSELEAIILETNLIKELKPKYNVLMKDDKDYVYVRIAVHDPYPAVEIVRRPVRDGAKIFGPFLSGRDVQATLDMLHELFEYRACKRSIDAANVACRRSEPVFRPAGRERLRPCVESQIGQCNGLCAHVLSQEEYRRRIDAILAFFTGDTRPARDHAQRLMTQSAQRREFERAAHYRDLLGRIAAISERQVVSDASGEDADVWGVAISSARASAVVLHERGGKVISEESLALTGEARDAADVLAQLLPQYYGQHREVPSTVVIEAAPEGQEALAALLRSLRSGSVELRIPARGKASKLLALAQRNAFEKLRTVETVWEEDERNTHAALTELRQAFSLSQSPARIEGYDISHLGGTETAGSMVVIRDGKPASAQYRSFAVRSLKRGEVDDCAALHEVLTRRLRHLAAALAAEKKSWSDRGILLRKSRKADAACIRALIEANPRDLSSDDLQHGKWFVAVERDAVIGCCRIFAHPSGLHELRSVCVNQESRGSRLGQALIRFALRTYRKGKLYIIIDPTLEAYYGEMGFRHVLRVPPALEKKVARILAADPALAPPVVMVFDAVQNKSDPSLETPPDLIVVDGGRGQLSVAVEVLQSFGLAIPVAAIAKREEEVFVPNRAVPVPFSSDSPARFLLMRLRDEAHRFSNKLRESRGWKAMVQSAGQGAKEEGSIARAV